PPIRLHLLEIVTSTERPPAGGKHDTAQGVVARCPIQRLLQPGQHVLGQRIELAGTVESEREHAVRELANDGRFHRIHTVSLFFYSPNWVRKRASRCSPTSGTVHDIPQCRRSTVGRPS